MQNHDGSSRQRSYISFSTPLTNHVFQSCWSPRHLPHYATFLARGVESHNANTKPMYNLTYGRKTLAHRSSQEPVYFYHSQSPSGRVNIYLSLSVAETSYNPVVGLLSSRTIQSYRPTLRYSLTVTRTANVRKS